MLAHRPARALMAAVLLCCASMACIARDYATDDGRSISHVNSGIDLAAGSVAGDLETVNGGISIGDNSQVGAIETVNGGFTLGDSVRIESLEGVNGGIKAGRELRIERGIETVNGGIELGSGAEIGGGIETVNSAIVLDHARIGGSVSFASGELDTGTDTRIDGDIHVEKANGWHRKQSRKPRVVIGPQSVVRGSIVLEQETELWVHDSATVGSVQGGNAQRYSGSAPRS